MQHIMTTSQRQQAMTQVNALVTNALTQFLEIGQLATLETDLLQMTPAPLPRSAPGRPDRLATGVSGSHHSMLGWW